MSSNRTTRRSHLASPSAAWRRFTASAADYHVEGPLDDPRAPLTAFLERTHAKRILLVTKEAMVRHWIRKDLLPSSTAVFSLHGPASGRHCALLKHQADERGLPLLFYGDLDPMDLTTFGTLRAGGTKWDFDPSTAIKAVYRGIDDSILSLVEQNLGWSRRSRSSHRSGPSSFSILRPFTTRMVPDERRHLEVIEKLMPDLEEIVGPRCIHLLRHGWKLEVEAFHSHSFKRGFETRLIQSLLAAPQKQCPPGSPSSSAD